jgi:branched-chain amino acid transport system ATP-binding protein
MSAPLLQVDELTVSYGAGSVAVDRLTLDVADGEVALVLGVNGAGKTSLLRGIGGFASNEIGRVRGGRVLLDGVDVTGRAPRAMARAGVVLVPEETKVFSGLTVGENLRAVPSPGSRAERQRLLDEVVELFPNIARRMDLPAGQLSGGERQLLGLARAILMRPRLLMVDEASLGLSPIAVREVFGTLHSLVSTGMTLLVVEQNVLAAESIADRAHVMESGAVVLTGPAGEVLGSDQVRRTYLGLEV